jgi:hypothetical protein
MANAFWKRWGAIAAEWASRAAEQAANAEIQRALAAGQSLDEAWEQIAQAAGRAASDAELAAGRNENEARQAAQQVEGQIRARAPSKQPTIPDINALNEGMAAVEAGLREKPWMEGYIRAMGVNPRTGPMPPLSPAETRCRQMFERRRTHDVPAETLQQDLDRCVEDLRQEWMASH